MPDALDRIIKGLLSYEQMSANADEIQAAAKQARAARWAMPAGDQVFPRVAFGPHDFNELVDNKAFQEFMMKIRRVVYDTKINLGFGGDQKENILAEGLAMSFGIFDDMEREIFAEDEPSQPQESSPREGE